MNSTSLQALTSCGHSIPTDDEHFGWLNASSDLLGNVAALREKFEEDGYLYLPGFFDEEDIMAARASMVERLEASGLLEPGTDPMDAIARADKRTMFVPELATDNPAVDHVVYNPGAFDFYERFFGEKALAFSFKWIRAVGPAREQARTATGCT